MRIWRFLEQPDTSPLCRAFHACWGLVIAASVGGAIALDMALPAGTMAVLFCLEVICTSLFTIELVVKLLCCPRRLAFMRSMYTVVDVAVIAQGFIAIFAGSSRSPVLSLLSTLAPILRLLKIARHSSGWRLLIISMRRCREPLLIPLYFGLLMVTFAGSLLYWVENSSLGDHQKAFLSVPHAMWFVVVTISTVGYGDIYPKSYAGKFIGAILIVAGVGYLAMPLAIIGQQFGDVWKERRVLLALGKFRATMGEVSLDMFKAAFTKHENDAGEIYFEQFEQVVDALDLGISRLEAREVFCAVDANCRGSFCFPEFEDFLFAYREPS